MVEAQKRSFKRILEQFLQVSQSHRGVLHRLEAQERSNRASSRLTTLLEQDRERFVYHNHDIHDYLRKDNFDVIVYIKLALYAAVTSKYIQVLNPSWWKINEEL